MTAPPTPHATRQAVGRSAAQVRRAQLAQVHIAKQQLQLSDADYRHVLRAVCRVDSSADLNAQGLKRLLTHFKKLGFVAKPPAPKPHTRALADDALAQKIRALWLMLHELGLVRNPAEAALAAYVRRTTGVDALQWLDSAQARVSIETLKKWAMRRLPAVVFGLADAVAARLKQGTLHLPEPHLQQLHVLLSRAKRRMTFEPMHHAWVELKQTIEGASPL